MSTQFGWNGLQTLESRDFRCGHCGRHVASDRGLDAVRRVGPRATAVAGAIRVCHLCEWPTFFDGAGRQYPGPAFGEGVEHLPSEDLANLYNEARNAIAVDCFTASVLCCRKLLMHVAVSRGAPQGKPFVSYVDYLFEQHLVPIDARSWIDHIRTLGNEANHEIKLMTREDAEELVTFSGMLLKNLFEFPARITKKAGV